MHSNIYVHFHFSHTHGRKPHHPLRCLLLTHKPSLMNYLEIPLAEYVNWITHNSNLTLFKIVFPDWPQLSGTKFVRLWKSDINQKDLGKAHYNKWCPMSGENKWSHCLPRSLNKTFISLHNCILFPHLYLKTEMIEMSRSNTQGMKYNVRDAKQGSLLFWHISVRRPSHN